MGGNKVIDNYVLLKVIGSGQFGDVYKAKRLDADEYVAIKTIKLDKFANTPQLHNLTKNEVEILTKIDNPNIIKFIKMLKTTNNIYIVYEYCNGGTLEELLDKKKFLPEKDAFQIFKQLINACKVMVQMKILHRDLKPSNILFHDGIVKIADFGFCKTLSSSYETTETMVGSPVYMAPEILKGQPYNLKADIYSLGVVLYEMLYGVVPFEDYNIPGLLNKIKEGNLVFHSFNKISPSTEHLIRGMLEQNQSKRMDWEEIFTFFVSDELYKEKELTIPLSSTTTTSVTDKIIDTKSPPSTGTLTDFKSTTDTALQTFTNIALGEIKDEKPLISRYIAECKKYRDKLIFLWRTFNQGCENLINEESHYINFMLLKKMHKINHDVLELFQNKMGLFTKDEFKLIKEQIDYGRTFSLMNNEIMKFDEIFSFYRNFIITSIDKKRTSKEMDIELTSYEFNEESFKEKVWNYATKLRNKMEYDHPHDESLGQRLGLLLNLLLDSTMLDEIYENFFDVSVSFNNQSYLNQLFNMEKKDLSEFADSKMRHLKIR